MSEKFNINKNVSVWRGDSTPPTDYHVWIKSDGTLLVKVRDSYSILCNPNIGDIINVSSINKNYEITLEEVLTWLATQGVIEYGIELHPGVMIKFKEEDIWKIYIYIGTSEEPGYEDVSNWKLLITSNSISDIEQTIEDTVKSLDIAEVNTTIDRVLQIWDGNQELVSLSLSGSWTTYNLSNDVVSTSPSFPVEYGYKAKYTGTWSWTSEDGKKNPTRTSGTWGTTLPESGVASESFTSADYVTSATTYSQTIYADKTGLMVSGSDVTPASGEDSKTVSTSASFSYRIYYGNSTTNTPTEDIIKGFTSVLGSKSRTLSSITTSSNEYFYYAYPQALGTLTTIIQDGATPVLTAFTLNSLTITNDAGLSVSLYVYVSNNPGAFTNVSLQFS